MALQVSNAALGRRPNPSGVEPDQYRFGQTGGSQSGGTVLRWNRRGRPGRFAELGAARKGIRLNCDGPSSSAGPSNCGTLCPVLPGAHWEDETVTLRTQGSRDSMPSPSARVAVDSDLKLDSCLSTERPVISQLGPGDAVRGPRPLSACARALAADLPVRPAGESVPPPWRASTSTAAHIYPFIYQSIQSSLQRRINNNLADREIEFVEVVDEQKEVARRDNALATAAAIVVSNDWALAEPSRIKFVLGESNEMNSSAIDGTLADTEIDPPSVGVGQQVGAVVSHSGRVIGHIETREDSSFETEGNSGVEIEGNSDFTAVPDAQEEHATRVEIRTFVRQEVRRVLRELGVGIRRAVEIESITVAEAMHIRVGALETKTDEAAKQQQEQHQQYLKEVGLVGVVAGCGEGSAQSFALAAGSPVITPVALSDEARCLAIEEVCKSALQGNARPGDKAVLARLLEPDQLLEASEVAAFRLIAGKATAGVIGLPPADPSEPIAEHQGLLRNAVTEGASVYRECEAPSPEPREALLERVGEIRGRVLVAPVRPATAASEGFPILHSMWRGVLRASKWIGEAAG